LTDVTSVIGLLDRRQHLIDDPINAFAGPSS